MSVEVVIAIAALTLSLVTSAIAILNERRAAVRSLRERLTSITTQLIDANAEYQLAMAQMSLLEFPGDNETQAKRTAFQWTVNEQNERIRILDRESEATAELLESELGGWLWRTPLTSDLTRGYRVLDVDFAAAARANWSIYDFARAIELFKQAIDTPGSSDHSSSMNTFSYGQLLTAMNQPDEGVKAFEQSIAHARLAHDGDTDVGRMSLVNIHVAVANAFGPAYDRALPDSYFDRAEELAGTIVTDLPRSQALHLVVMARQAWPIVPAGLAPPSQAVDTT